MTNPKPLTHEEQAQIGEEDYTEYLEWTPEEEDEFMRMVKEQVKKEEAEGEEKKEGDGNI